MHDCFELFDEPLAEDGEVGVVHFDVCSILGLEVSPKETGSEILPRASTLFPPNPIKGISAGWRRFLSMFILSKVLEKMISAELPVSTSIFSMVQP